MKSPPCKRGWNLSGGEIQANESIVIHHFAPVNERFQRHSTE